MTLGLHTTQARRLLRKIGFFLVRVASTAAGILIEYRQIYGPRAQVDLIGLGLLLICVPPTLWLDTLARLSKVADAVSAAKEMESGDDSSDKAHRRVDDHPSRHEGQ